MKNYKRMIWSNMDLEIEDYEDYFLEEEEISGEKLTNEEKHMMMHDLNNMYIEDEMDNLNIELNGRILVLADLGLWNGRRQGYKVIHGNLSEIFDTGCDFVEWFVEDGELRSRQVHHDGTNHLVYREINEDRDIDKLLGMLYNGEEISNQRLSSYTRSLAPVVQKCYGW